MILQRVTETAHNCHGLVRNFIEVLDFYKRVLTMGNRISPF